jgi:hypothetical protein
LSNLPENFGYFTLPGEFRLYFPKTPFFRPKAQGGVWDVENSLSGHGVPAGRKGFNVITFHLLFQAAPLEARRFHFLAGKFIARAVADGKTPLAGAVDKVGGGA